MVKKVLDDKILEYLEVKNSKFVSQSKRIEEFLYLNYLEFFEQLILPLIETEELKQQLCEYLAELILKQKITLFSSMFISSTN